MNITQLRLQTDMATLTLPIALIERAEDAAIVAELIRDNSIVASFQLNAFIKGKNGEKAITSFGQKIIVAIPYTDNSSIDTITAMRDQTENIGGQYLSDRATYYFFTDVPGHFIIQPFPNALSDLSAASWAEESVQALSAKGVFDDKDQQPFLPNTHIRFGELQDWAIRMAGASNTKVAARLSGEMNATLSRDAYVQRQDLAVIAAKLLEAVALPKPKPNQQHTDMLQQFTDWGDMDESKQSSMSYATYYNIIVGHGNHTITPRAHATKAEAAIVLYKLMQLLQK